MRPCAEPVERELLSLPSGRAVEDIVTGLCNSSVTASLGVHERLKRATYQSIWRLLRHACHAYNLICPRWQHLPWPPLTKTKKATLLLSPCNKQLI
jgi:hypothetical protein